MLVRFIASLLKLMIASLAIGAVLSHFDVSTAKLLATVGMTPDDLVRLVIKSYDWALPKVFLGAIVVIPTWVLLNLLRPPRGYE